MFGIGIQELLVILVILLLFFGKDRLPGLAKSIGNSVRELRSGISGALEEEKSGTGEAAGGKLPFLSQP